MLTRRRFLGIAGGLAAGGGALWAAGLRDHLDGGPPPTGKGPSSDRVLVVVQLSGGNDGLNTLVPADGRYRDARPTIAVPEAGLVALAGTTAYSLHPSLAPLAPLWQAGHIAAVQSIGYEGSSRSHFAALRSWWAAKPDGSGTDGWLGRWLDGTGVADGNPLAAVALAGAGTPALSAGHAVSTVIVRPELFSLALPGRTESTALVDAFLATAAPLAPDPLLAAAQAAIPTSVEAVHTLQRDHLAGAGADSAGGGKGDITDGLAIAARIVELDAGTRVILVGGGGFDTHASEEPGHGSLLGDLAGGIAAFFSALTDKGVADRVLLVTTSEFGRQVAENGSGGTDHGAGSVQFVVGPKVRGGVVGDLDLAALDDGDVRPQIDVRSLYAVALDWLGGPTDDILGARYDRHDLLRA
jgi:uncharacterized protein (DUF1501 family)